MPNFPNGFDTDDSLFIAVNNLKNELSSNIDAVTLTIPVNSTAGFPDVGFITIPVGADITQSEAIKYTSITPTAFNATERGAGGTPAAAHSSGDEVLHTVIASHHNELKDAVIALEHFVGVSGSESFLEDFVETALIGAGAVTVISGTSIITISGTTSFQDITVSGLITATSGSFSQSLTVSGVPVIIDPPEFPAKGTKSFLTTSVAATGGTAEIDESFNDRSLVRKLTVDPTNSAVDSFIIEFYKSDSFLSTVLEYKATASGTFVDNDVWFHEDEDATDELHLKLTNNSTTSSTFTVTLVAEVFA